GREEEERQGRLGRDGVEGDDPVGDVRPPGEADEEGGDDEQLGEGDPDEDVAHQAGSGGRTTRASSRSIGPLIASRTSSGPPGGTTTAWYWRRCRDRSRSTSWLSTTSEVRSP